MNKACIILTLVIVWVCYSPFTSANTLDSLRGAYNNTVVDTQKLIILEAICDKFRATDCQDTIAMYEALKDYYSLANTIRHPRHLLQSQMYFGDYYDFCKHNAVKAIEWYNVFAVQSGKLGNKKAEARALNSISRMHEKSSNYALALQYARMSIKIDPDPVRVSAILANIGYIYTSIGDYPNAVVNYINAYDMFNRNLLKSQDRNVRDSMMLMGLLNNIADIYIAMADYEKAIGNYKHVQSLNKSVQYLHFDIASLNGIGKCLMLQKKYVEALEYYKQALGIAVDMDMLGDECNALVELANIYLGMGDIEKAHEHVNLALQVVNKKTVSTSENDFIYRPSIYGLLGKIYTHEKRYRLAVDYLNQAISLFNRSGKIQYESDMWATLSHTYEEMNKPVEAYEAYKQHIKLRDSIFSQDKARQITRTEMQGEFDRKQFADSLKTVEVKKLSDMKLRRQRNYTYVGISAVLVLLAFSYFIVRERGKSDKLLLNILPVAVARELKQKGTAEPKMFDNVTVLFTDFVSFTNVSENLTPKQLVDELHNCFKAFDEIVTKYQIEKIKTIGDAYLAVSGLPMANSNHAENVLNAAIEIRNFMAARRKKMGNKTFDIRIGVNSGLVVAGIVGVTKFAYDIWGDTVNTAARMEQNSEPGKINVSQNTYELVKGKFSFTYRGELSAKNKGLLKMYFVEA